MSPRTRRPIHFSWRQALQLTVLPALALILSTSPAAAAGTGLPLLVRDIGAALMVAGGLAVVLARLRIPSIAGFLVAGVVLGPQGLHVITDAENIEAIAQIGFVLLLFVIGLEINLRKLLGSGKATIMAGVIQYPVTLLFGLFAAKVAVWVGFGEAFGSSPLAPLYVGVAIAGSSSLLVVKLFQEHFQLDTQPGRVALIVLIFQDIWAIVVTLLQPNLENPHFSSIAFSFLGIGLLLAIALLLSRGLATHMFAWIAKKPEMILLGAMAWCFAIVAIGTSIDRMTEVFGFNLHLSVGAGMAALIAGATIASSPFSTEIVTKVGLVKDFFITLFFVGLGITLPPIVGWNVPLLAIGLGFLAILARQLVFFPLFYAVGNDQRSAQVCSVQLAQISEFGLVIAFLGRELGHISGEVATVIILAFVITAILTTPLFENAYRIHSLLQPVLTFLGFREPGAEEASDKEIIELAILGVHRDASSFLGELARCRPEVLKHTVVVDFNVALHERLRELGVTVKYGDISNEETLRHVGVDRARVVLCPISPDLLRGINASDLVRLVRHINPQAVIIANAIEIRGWEALRAAGADIVYMPRLEVARSLIDAFDHALEGRADEFVDRQHQTFGHPGTRREVMD